jgi:ATP-dependent RNA helicase RhlE
MKNMLDLFRFTPGKSSRVVHAANESMSSDSHSSFTHLNLDAPLLAALAAQGYSRPTPIQSQAIPPILAGKDLLGCAQTGTGKTAAFALPILQLLSRENRNGVKPKNSISALILAPTRELALQIGESFAAYGAETRVRHTVIYGGVSQEPQVSALRRSPHIVVATPGRLLDLMGQGHVNLGNLSVFVLDEADHMLDLGFIPDIKRIMATLPRVRQTLLFSATMPPKICELANSLLKSPVKVEVAPPATTAETIEQKVYFIAKTQKMSLLQNLLFSDETMKKVLVFTRTKHGANRVAEMLQKTGQTAAAIHGNKSQAARQRALSTFKSGQLRVLVASDIAARGIDIDEVTHVINLDIPNIAESYVHRIGRTGRARAAGVAISFCDAEERMWLKDIEKLIGVSIPVAGNPPTPAAPNQAHPGASLNAVDYERRENNSPRPRSNRPAHQGAGAHSRPHAKPNAKPDSRPHAKPNAKPDSRSHAKPNAKPDSRPHTKPNAKPDSRSHAKPNAKPDSRSHAKPNAKPNLPQHQKPAKAGLRERV